MFCSGAAVEAFKNQLSIFNFNYGTLVMDRNHSARRYHQMASVSDAVSKYDRAKPAGNVNPLSLDEHDPLLVFFPGLG
jgi:hypothetical protein